MNRKTFWPVSMIVLCAIAVSPKAYAQSCDDFINEHIDWLAHVPPSVEHSLKVVMVSNAPNQLVSYSEGPIDTYVPRDPSIYGALASIMSRQDPRPPGTAQTGYEISQYFNDRPFCYGSEGSFPLCNHPFNPFNTDRLGIIMTEPSSYSDGQVTLRLLSWGGGSYSLTNLSCSPGLMYGRWGDTVFVISLKKVETPRL